ncbi:hypothetical protein D9611_005429 [Ephemerocybe angulata]|uniref:Transmembrane protein n=1 Tax=Ephemerocybe angulata TaxID=980116 RepID=A0A8H5C053_9AGAR|nr:hypothetical protein D9611_005429 [Tulosesus angulatus]
MSLIIVDDFELGKLGRYWKFWRGLNCTSSAHELNAYNGTILSCHARDNKSVLGPVSLSIQYSGSTLVLVGRPTAKLKLKYTLDNEPILQQASLNITTENIGKNGAAFWSLNTPPAGVHTVEILPYDDDFHLDYIACKDPIAADALNTDARYYVGSADTDKVKYYGDWDVTRRDTAALPTLPFGGSWSSTSTTGGLSTNFTGEQIFLYGYKNYAEGTLRLRYTIDENITQQLLVFDGQQPVNASRWEFVNLFNATVDPGNHTLTLEAVATEGQSFNLNFLTYSPSPPPAWITHDSPPSGADSNGGHSNKIVILGAVIGSVGGSLLLVVLYLLLRYHKKAKAQAPKNVIPLQPYPTSQGPTVPFDMPDPYAARVSPTPQPHDSEDEDWDSEGPTRERAPPPWAPPQAGESTTDGALLPSGPPDPSNSSSSIQPDPPSYVTFAPYAVPPPTYPNS